MEVSRQVMVAHPLEAWKDAVSTSATLATLILFLTGIQVCRKVVKLGHIGDFSVVPFLAGILNCAVWLRYGICIHEPPVFVVNSIGFVLQASYACLFYSYGKDSRMLILKQILAALAALGCIIFVTDVILKEQEIRREVTGFIGCTLAVTFFASPLVSLAHVIKTRSTEVLPYLMILANCTVSGLWWIYGIILNDNFIKVPNFIGFCLACCQLVPFVIFPSKSAESSKQLDNA